MIKDLGARVITIWEGLRPMTKRMLVGLMQSNSVPTPNPITKFAYDAHVDWELSRLLSALDEQYKVAQGSKDPESRGELRQLAETCVRVLESRSGSAEVFIQLATRALQQRDYNKLDKLSDTLVERFSAGEIAEIIRQTELPQIRAIAYETLVLLPVSAIEPLIDDVLYTEIAMNSLEQKAYEYESEEARDLLDHLYNVNDQRGE